jgi:hypothetical protein
MRFSRRFKKSGSPSDDEVSKRPRLGMNFLRLMERLGRRRRRFQSNPDSEVTFLTSSILESLAPELVRNEI